MALHGGIGLLTGGLQGAVGAVASAALIPMIGEKIAEMNLPKPVRDALTIAVGAGIGAVAGGGNGAAAALNETANNYISRSPFAAVRRTVSQENARLTNQCGTDCTQEDFNRIDRQMAKLEAAASWAAAAEMSSITPEGMQEFSQLVLELIPFYGTGESLVQLVTGQASMTGEEVNRFWAAIGVVPAVGGVVRKVGEPSVHALAAILKGLPAGPIYKTTKEAALAAEALGFTKINETSHGQAVFKRGKEYITRDVDGHNKGAWKLADSIKALASKETRTGTFDVNLERIGD